MKQMIVLSVLVGQGLLGCGEIEPIEQSEDCVAMLACKVAISDVDHRENTLAEDEALYGPNGSCWESGTNHARMCQTSCAGMLNASIYEAELRVADGSISEVPSECTYP